MDIYKTMDGYEVEIIERCKYDGWGRNIMLCRENGYMCSVTDRDIKNGFNLLIFGFGYIKPDSKEHFMSIMGSDAYKRYYSMIHRCYSDDPACFRYRDVSVCDEWRDFNNFEAWFNDNYVPGFHLDKDLFSTPGVKKMYSPVTCCFIPPSVNVMIGTNKDHVIKRGDKYGFIDKSIMIRQRYILFNSEQEAKDMKRMCMRLKIKTIVEIYYSVLKKRVVEKLLSLYE